MIAESSVSETDRYEIEACLSSEVPEPGLIAGWAKVDPGGVVNPAVLMYPSV